VRHENKKTAKRDLRKAKLKSIPDKTNFVITLFSFIPSRMNLAPSSPMPLSITIVLIRTKKGRRTNRKKIKEVRATQQHDSENKIV